MQAYLRTGPVDQTVIAAEVPAPSLATSEVRVAPEAFDVGVHDRYFIPETTPFPYVIGSEGAGEVVQLGSSVDGVAIGDRVMVMAALSLKGGTWAEEVAVAPTALRQMPDELEMTETRHARGKSVVTVS